MGCDIHMHIEIKVKGRWRHYNQPDIDRSYELFAKMAGVRNYSDHIEPIDKPRGIPDDIDLVTQLEYQRWDGDAHSESWLNAEELNAVNNWYREQTKNDERRQWYPFGFLFGNDFDAGNLKDLASIGVEDVRGVFWFDN